MERIAINPGVVDWSGENPGMYLKEQADGGFVTLISFFRMVWSSHGRGTRRSSFSIHTATAGRLGRRTCASRTTSPRARFLAQDFVANFGPFKGDSGTR
jgi:hypothetical protein